VIHKCTSKYNFDMAFSRVYDAKLKPSQIIVIGTVLLFCESFCSSRSILLNITNNYLIDHIDV